MAVEQEVATFYCQHLSCDGIAWLVNGTSLNKINSPNITISSSGTVRLLSIETLLEYSGTTVECVALFFDGTPSISSLPVTLMIQGIYVIVYILICPLPLFCEQIRVFFNIVIFPSYILIFINKLINFFRHSWKSKECY